MSKTAKVLSTTGAAAVLVILAVAVFGVSSKSKVGDAAEQPSLHSKVDRIGTESLLSAPVESVDIPIYTWKNYTTADGLPAQKLLAIHVDGDRVWIGTTNGLVLFEDGKFRTFTTEDGLSHNFIVNIEVDEATGDVWIGTGSGLTRYSAGKFEIFNQFNSGLANDFVYCVYVDGKDVWAATASGVSRYDTHTGQWSIWNETNAPMHEPWTYAVTEEFGRIYVGAWGGGLLEMNKETEHWKDYVDPDGEMEVDVFPDDGIVHDIVSFLTSDEGVLWISTYFGLSLYDGVRWKGYFDTNSGLISSFINYVAAKGQVGYLCTDRGLSTFDRKIWRTFVRKENGQGEIIINEEYGKEIGRITTPTALINNYIQAIDFQGDTLWVATEAGLSVGIPSGRTINAELAMK